MDTKPGRDALGKVSTSVTVRRQNGTLLARDVFYGVRHLWFEKLRWYLEDYLERPLSAYRREAQEVECSLPEWGERLNRDVFGSLGHEYVPDGPVVIRANSSSLARTPWELLKPYGGRPTALECGVSRAPVGELPLTTQVAEPATRSRRLRILFVISRPEDANPLTTPSVVRGVATVLSQADSVDIEVLRPPTITNLKTTLAEAMTAGRPYDVVHFDGHGRAVSVTHAQDILAIQLSAVRNGELLFESDTGRADPVGAAEFAAVLSGMGVRLVVLNACHSGEIGDDLETGFGNTVLREGIPAFVAMSFTTYVRSATVFVESMYSGLVNGDTIGDAVVKGRRALVDLHRARTELGETAILDWMVPVLYTLNPAQGLTSTGRQFDNEFTISEPVEPLLGRDRMFHVMECALQQRLVLVLHGMTGIGKTRTANCFAEWIARTDPRYGGTDPMAVSMDDDSGSWPVEALDGQIMCNAKEPRVVLLDDLVPEATDASRVANLVERLEQAGHLVLITADSAMGWLDRFPRLALAGPEPELHSITAKTPRSPKADLGEDAVAGEIVNRCAAHPGVLQAFLRVESRLDTASAYAVLSGRLHDVEEDGFEAVWHTVERRYHRIGSAHRPIIDLLAALPARSVSPAIIGGVKVRAAPFDGKLGDEAVERAFDAATEVGLATKRSDLVYELHPALSGWLRRTWPSRLGGSGVTIESIEAAFAEAYAVVASYALSSFDASKDPDRFLFLKQQRTVFETLLAAAVREGDWSTAIPLFHLVTAVRGRLGLEVDPVISLVLSALSQRASLPPPALSVEWGIWLDVLSAQADAALQARDWAALLSRARLGYDQLRKTLDHDLGDTRLVQLFTDFATFLVRVAEHQGDWDGARRQLQDALTICKAADDKPSLSRLYHEYAWTFGRAGEVDSALKWHLASLKISQELNDLSGTAVSLRAIADVLLLKGKKQEASTALMKSAAIGRTLGDRAGMAACYTKLAQMSIDRRDSARASQWLSMSLSIQTALKDYAGLADTYAALASVASQRYMPQQVWWLEECVHAAGLSGRPSLQAWAHERLGDYYVHQDPATARQHYSNALELIPRGAPQWRESIHERMAQCCEKLTLGEEALAHLRAATDSAHSRSALAELASYSVAAARVGKATGIDPSGYLARAAAAYESLGWATQLDWHLAGAEWPPWFSSVRPQTSTEPQGFPRSLPAREWYDRAMKLRAFARERADQDGTVLHTEQAFLIASTADPPLKAEASVAATLRCSQVKAEGDEDTHLTWRVVEACTRTKDDSGLKGAALKSLAPFVSSVGLAAVGERWEAISGRPMPPATTTALLSEARKVPLMLTANPANVARLAAEELSTALDKPIAEDVELILQAPPTDGEAKLADPVSIASLIVACANLAWTIYNDLVSRAERNGNDPRQELERAIRAEIDFGTQEYANEIVSVTVKATMEIKKTQEQ